MCLFVTREKESSKQERRQIAIIYVLIFLAIVLPYVWAANSFLDTPGSIVGMEGIALGISGLAYIFRRSEGPTGHFDNWEPECRKNAMKRLIFLVGYLFLGMGGGHILLWSNPWKFDLVVTDALDFTNSFAAMNLCAIVLLFLAWNIFQELKRVNM